MNFQTFIWEIRVEILEYYYVRGGGHRGVDRVVGGAGGGGDAEGGGHRDLKKYTRKTHGLTHEIQINPKKFNYLFLVLVNVVVVVAVFLWGNETALSRILQKWQEHRLRTFSSFPPKEISKKTFLYPPCLSPLPSENFFPRKVKNSLSCYSSK